MADQEGKQQSRSRSTRRPADEDPAGKDTAAPEPPATAAPESADDTPPESESSDDGKFPKDALIRRAHDLLGVPPSLARGVLAEADDELTIDQANTAVQEYLNGEVKITEEG